MADAKEEVAREVEYTVAELDEFHDADVFPSSEARLAWVRIYIARQQQLNGFEVTL